MSGHFPIVFETEKGGAVSAFVPGLPVYAAADTLAQVRTAIRGVLSAYLQAHPKARPSASVQVASVSTTHAVTIVGVGALLGAGRSRAKALSSRQNGKLGGRPRKQPQHATAK